MWKTKWYLFIIGFNSIYKNLLSAYYVQNAVFAALINTKIQSDCLKEYRLEYHEVWYKLDWDVYSNYSSKKQQVKRSEEHSSTELTILSVKVINNFREGNLLYSWNHYTLSTSLFISALSESKDLSVHKFSTQLLLTSSSTNSIFKYNF